MKELLEYIVKKIVSYPEEISIEEYEDGAFTILRIKSNEADIGKIIGKNGKVAQSLRAIVRSASKDKRYLIKIGDKN